MPTVKTSHTTDHPVDRVWPVLLDCESFPSYMDEVREVRLIEDDGVRRVGHWRVLLKGSELDWQEEEIVDHERKRIEFRQIEGDLDYFAGYWQVTETPSGTLVEMHVDFDIGSPLMADMLNPVAARALEDNSRRILAQLGDRASQGSPDQAQAQA